MRRGTFSVPHRLICPTFDSGNICSYIYGIQKHSFLQKHVVCLVFFALQPTQLKIIFSRSFPSNLLFLWEGEKRYLKAFSHPLWQMCWTNVFLWIGEMEECTWYWNYTKLVGSPDWFRSDQKHEQHLLKILHTSRWLLLWRIPEVGSLRLNFRLQRHIIHHLKI